MNKFKQRVVHEKIELDTKATALSNFIGTSEVFLSLSDVEQELLKEQCELMWEYSEVLGKRVELF